MGSLELPNPMSNFLSQLKQWQKAVLDVIGVIVAVIVLICVWQVWSHDPVVMPRLLLIVLVFASTAGGMILLGNRRIEGIKVEGRPDAESRIDTIVVGTILVVLVLTGALIQTAGLISFAANGFRAACFGLLASLAALVVGVVIGFLFGVPRSVAAPDRAPTRAAPPPPQTPVAQTQAPETATQPPPATVPPSTSVGAAAPVRYEPNTNLTQISDWLTKAIVGVGLVNWRDGLEWFDQTSAALGKILVGDSAPIIGGSIIIFFGASGFLCGYNLTQLFLARALARGETQE